ncbi:site-specific integrase [Croceibacter atlanticus]|uniref:tyrosine-type recombinase/integrase n=1 Tax=Croceibacter atlanticus TaxID=313588 RepID=UPI0030F87337
MDFSQKKTTSHIPFIDYVPAELKISSSNGWQIVFYARKPGCKRLQRVRRRVKAINGHSNRKKYAKRICNNIDEKLQLGWSPFIDGSGKDEYLPLEDILTKFLEQTVRKCNDGTLRPDTLRSYRSYIRVFTKYLKERNKSELFVAEFTKPLVIEFLDDIYYVKKRSAGTSNNYLTFLNQVSIFMVERGLLPDNPIASISQRSISKKKRENIPSDTLDEIFKFHRFKSPGYYTLMLTIYNCFIRRTEMTKLKVKHIDLERDVIFISRDISKNRKDSFVTITKRLKIALKDHLKNSNDEDYLFSDNNYKPGEERLTPKKISDEWIRTKKSLKFKNTYQFYSLKDTGITNMFHLNIPTIKIRDQARHHDIRITETYTPRLTESDSTIKNLDF